MNATIAPNTNQTTKLNPVRRMASIKAVKLKLIPASSPKLRQSSAKASNFSPAICTEGMNSRLSYNRLNDLRSLTRGKGIRIVLTEPMNALICWLLSWTGEG